MLVNENNESVAIRSVLYPRGVWMICAGENHISIVPDRFLYLPGQAKIHMYSCDV
jgi:hypothetical protein